MAEVHVRGINQNTWNEFKKIVMVKYGKKHTVLGLEVGVALQEYINNHTLEKTEHTHTKSSHQYKNNYTIKKINTCKELLEDAGIIYSVIHGSCHSNAIKKVIQGVVGYDERTTKKYLKLLCDELSWDIVEEGYVQERGRYF